MINHQPLKTKGQDRGMQAEEAERPHIDGPALVAEWVGILPTLDTRHAAEGGRGEGVTVGLSLRPLVLNPRKAGTKNPVDGVTITKDDQRLEGTR